MKINFSGKLFLSVISISVIAVIFATGYKFLWFQDYNFIVEASCDPTTEACFQRDCSVPDDCPPNGLESYKTYMLSAADFSQCGDSSCEFECKNNMITSCVEIACGSSEENQCTVPEVVSVSSSDDSSELNDESNL